MKNGRNNWNCGQGGLFVSISGVLMKNESGNIRVLPDHVINKIAAGEVVERPASVVKELVENALDAGATEISVEVTSGGRTLISVADNGRGMNRNDALLSVERHATSKISDVDDIERVATLGFRGEALAAISSVSRFTLRSRPAADLSGTEITMSGGKMQEVRDAGCPPGAIVEVRHLFFNVPARRKFLRSDQTELAHIRSVFMMYALVNHTIGLRLKADGKLIYNLPANASLDDRLADLFDFISKEHLRPLSFASGNMRVSGYAAVPSLTRADRSEQYLFINRRPVAAGLLAGAIREGYRTLIPKERHPVVFIFLDLNPEQVDVNVHPAKKEVRFRNPGEVRGAVAGAIREALANQPAKDFSIPVRSDVKKQPAGREEAPVWDYAGIKKKAAPVESVLPMAVPTGTKAENPAEKTNKPWAWCRIIGQIGNLYVILETNEGLVLMDPHAAHERVLFEKFMSEVSGSAVKSQALLMAESVSLPPVDAVRIRRMLDGLRKTGFGISEFGRDTFLVDAVPACFGDLAARNLIVEIAASLAESSGRNNEENLLAEQIARAACRAAVKAHAHLSAAELESLVDQLEKAEMPYTCPHGRPVIICFSLHELARKFGRNAPRG